MTAACLRDCHCYIKGRQGGWDHHEPLTAWAIPRALWAEPGGAAWYNQLWRAINNKPSLAWARAKFEQIPLFYQRCCVAPLRGSTPIAALERFVVYFLSELIISGSTPGRCPEGTGNCSSCYWAHIGLVSNTDMGKLPQKIQKFWENFPPSHQIMMELVPAAEA